MSKPKDVAASVSARLSNYALEHDYIYQEALQYYAIERLIQPALRHAAFAAARS